MRGAHPFQRLSLGKRLTLLVMIAMALSCIVLAAAMTVAVDQMLYTIYASQTTVTRGDDRYGLPTVSKGAAASGTILLPTGEKGPLYAEDRGLGAKFKYRIESIVYVICTIAVAGVATYMITENCLSPLVNLKNQVANLSAQNLSDSPEGGAPQTGDEIESLSNAFQGMRLRLESAFETQKRFAANAAHELRTPLALMQAQLELFSAEHPDVRPETAEFLTLLREQTERLIQMTRTLLEMSNLRQVARNERIQLAPMIEEIFTDLAPLSDKLGVTLTAEGDGIMTGSDALIYRLIFNLTENAVKYNRPGGSVRVSVTQELEKLLLRVSDTGCGIPEVYQRSIFQPFFRVDKSRSREYGGAGLGLSLVWEIADLHGGSVWVEKSSEKGTTIAVGLPTQQSTKP